MTGTSVKKTYRRPRVTSERVFEQAALSCVVSSFGNTYTTLKISATTCGGCGYASS